MIMCKKKRIDLDIKRLDKFVKQESSSNECILCRNKISSACNSHVVPVFILKQIAEEGKVAYGYALSKINYVGLDKVTGINNAHTFRLICNKCDKEYFKNYEDKQKINNYFKLNSLDKQQMLSEMAIKTHLSHIDMKYKDYIRLSAVGAAAKYPGEAKAKELDISEYLGYIAKIKSDIFFHNQSFCVLYEKELPYKTKIATQTIINYNYDLKGNKIFDATLLKNSNQCRYFYLMILPLENKTLVLFYIEKENINNVSTIIEQFESLSEEDKLHFLFISLIIHDQQFYLAPSLANYIIKHDKKLERLYTKTEFIPCQKKIANFKKYNNYLTDKNLYELDKI